MKTLIYTTGFLTLIMFSGCLSNSFLVDSDFNYDGKFADYQSFGFFDFNTSGLDEYYTQRVRDIVITRLTSLGYKYDPENPDLQISFRYLNEEMVLLGYNQANLSSWVFKQNLRPHGNDEKKYEKNKVRLPSGSLMMYMMESKQGELVWLGYSNMHNIRVHERNLMASVGMILDKYNVSKYQ